MKCGRNISGHVSLSQSWQSNNLVLKRSEARGRVSLAPARVNWRS